MSPTYYFTDFENLLQGLTRAIYRALLDRKSTPAGRMSKLEVLRLLSALQPCFEASLFLLKGVRFPCQIQMDKYCHDTKMAVFVDLLDVNVIVSALSR